MGPIPSVNADARCEHGINDVSGMTQDFKTNVGRRMDQFLTAVNHLPL